MKHEILFGIVGLVAVIIAALVSYNIIEEKRITALSSSIESASARGIDPVAVRCAYATTNDTICIVYASKK
jgi:peptidoglycan/LPS O-acetylase OafA/YrhL